MNTKLTLALFCSLFLCAAVHAEEAAVGGEQVFNGKDLTGWRVKDARNTETWKVVSALKLDPADPKKLEGEGTGGDANGILFRSPVAHGSDIISEKQWGDCEVHVEFMVPKGANSGVYLMGRYEVQVFDSFGKDKMGTGDCAAIYGVKAPSENAAKAPGEWQSFDIIFQAPRFDAAGKKTANAKFLKVYWNGKLVQENSEAKGPTGSEIEHNEKPTGPLMFQGDHGIVGFRNVRVKASEGK
jgi:hypothetical protein